MRKIVLKFWRIWKNYYNKKLKAQILKFNKMDNKLNKIVIIIILIYKNKDKDKILI